jgi:hypothetical protein
MPLSRAYWNGSAEGDRSTTASGPAAAFEVDGPEGWEPAASVMT